MSHSLSVIDLNDLSRRMPALLIRICERSERRGQLVLLSSMRVVQRCAASESPRLNPRVLARRSREADPEQGARTHVDASPLVDDLLDDLVALGRRVVVGDGVALAGRLDLGDHLVGVLAREVVDEDLGAARGEEERVCREVERVSLGPWVRQNCPTARRDEDERREDEQARPRPPPAPVTMTTLSVNARSCERVGAVSECPQRGSGRGCA